MLARDASAPVFGIAELPNFFSHFLVQLSRQEYSEISCVGAMMSMHCWSRLCVKFSELHLMDGCFAGGSVLSLIRVLNRICYLEVMESDFVAGLQGTLFL